MLGPGRRLPVALLLLATILLLAIPPARAQTHGVDGTPSPMTQPPGTVLASDDCSDPSTGVLPRSPQAAPWSIGCLGGEYQFSSAGLVGLAAGNRFRYVLAAGTYTDVSAAVDVHLAPNSDSDTAVGIGCRYSGGGENPNGYRMYYFPAKNQWNLGRVDAGTFVSLTGRNAAFSASGAPLSGVPAHLQLTCAGDTLTVSVNGAQVFSVQDENYQQGRVALTAGMGTVVNAQDQVYAGYTGMVDARFTNFVITQP